MFHLHLLNCVAFESVTVNLGTAPLHNCHMLHGHLIHLHSVSTTRSYCQQPSHAHLLEVSLSHFTWFIAIGCQFMTPSQLDWLYNYSSIVYLWIFHRFKRWYGAKWQKSETRGCAMWKRWKDCGFAWLSIQLYMASVALICWTIYAIYTHAHFERG